MDLGLAGKRAIVTGGSKGIGAATARVLAGEGVRVSLIARDREALDAVAAECGRGAVSFSADLADAAQLSAAFAAAIEAMGGVDILVNNAGSSPHGSILEIGDDAWRDSFDLKLMGYVRGMRAVIPTMQAQHYGRIVNIGGVAGVSANSGYVLASYNTAIVHITRSVAELVGPDGITVTTVHPGPTLTERLRGMLAGAAATRGMTVDEFGEQVVAQTAPLRRLGSPEEVAQVIAFMCGEPSAWITGTGLLVDGGIAKGKVSH